jgi:hypothetical protein
MARIRKDPNAADMITAALHGVTVVPSWSPALGAMVAELAAPGRT